MDSKSKHEYLRLLKQKAEMDAEYLRSWKPNGVVQEAAVCSRARIVVVSGGNQSGKSEAGGIKTSICSTGIVPKSLEGKFPVELIKPGAYWCSSLDAAGSRDIVKDKLDTILPPRLIAQYHGQDNIYYLKDKMGQIGLKYEGSGRALYQGVKRYGVWMDEEHTKAVYREIYERVSTLGGWIFFTFSPIEGLTWSFKDLYKRARRIYFSKNKHGIPEGIGLVHTLDEIKLMRDRELCIDVREGEEYDENIEVFILTKYDNPYQSDAVIQQAERDYSEDIASYNSRLLGRYTKVDNRCVLPVQVLVNRQNQLLSSPPKIQVGDIVNGVFVPSKKGKLKIFKEKKEVGSGFYIVAADVALGTEEGDNSVIQVLDHKTCEQVAVWASNEVSPENFAKTLIDVAKWFNYAWLAPERNFHGIGVVSRIRDEKYRGLYSEYDIVQETVKTHDTQTQKTYGWETSLKTRPIMIQDLADFIKKNHVVLNDVDTIEECLTFIYDKDGKTQARKGCLDDRVIALAIALQVQQRKRPTSFFPSLGMQQKNTPPPKKRGGLEMEY